jgi:hypothetical protein
LPECGAWVQRGPSTSRQQADKQAEKQARNRRRSHEKQACENRVLELSAIARRQRGSVTARLLPAAARTRGGNVTTLTSCCPESRQPTPGQAAAPSASRSLQCTTGEKRAWYRLSRRAYGGRGRKRREIRETLRRTGCRREVRAKSPKRGPAVKASPQKTRLQSPTFYQKAHSL